MLRMSFPLAAVVTLLFANTMAARAAEDRPNPSGPSGYARLLSALTAGRDVTALAHFDQCALVGTANHGPAVVGGFRIESFIVPGNRYIAFSSVHETLNEHNQRVTEFIRYRVMQDGKVSIRTLSVQHASAEVSNEAQYECQIGTGVDFIS
jgi:VirK protein